MIYTIINRSRSRTLPLASQVLNSYLKQQNYPHWTSYFVKYKDCVNDQFGQSYFINKCPEKPHWRYLILRTGCFPFMKYHCTRLDPNMIIDEKQIKFQNGFFNLIKLINLGIPTLAYGIGGYLLVKHEELVETSKGPIKIYFLIKENKNSIY